MQQLLIRLIIGFFVPSAMFLALLKIQAFWRSHLRIRLPVSDRLLRPPGETLRVRLDALNTELMGWMMLAVLMSVAAALIFPTPVNPIVLVFDLLVLAFLLWQFVHTLRIRNNYWLGFSGERAVGELLNGLAMDGCHVFHDFPAEPNWNIDHIVVAPIGVFAVETKTRRKRKAPPGKEDHVVTFDGDCLRFPSWSDRRSLDQARGNARWLGEFLTKAVGQPVQVTPILTLPGWYVELKARSEFPIVNPKGIRSVVLPARPPVLDEQTMQRIAFQLDQKCRDVEF